MSWKKNRKNVFGIKQKGGINFQCEKEKSIWTFTKLAEGTNEKFVGETCSELKALQRLRNTVVENKKNECPSTNGFFPPSKFRNDF